MIPFRVVRHVKTKKRQKEPMVTKNINSIISWKIGVSTTDFFFLDTLFSVGV